MKPETKKKITFMKIDLLETNWKKASMWKNMNIIVEENGLEIINVRR